MKRLFVLLIMSMVLSCLVSTSALAAPASEESAPLQRMLAFAPDAPEIRAGEVRYVDFEAMIAARPGAAQPKNYQEWLAIQADKTPEAGRYLAALQGISTGSAELLMQFVRPEGMVTALGIDPYTIQRMLLFGTPPSTALVLDGTFDPAAIDKALAARSYQKQSDVGGFGLWCSADGCEIGAKANLPKRDTSNPFGGSLGRQQPIAASAAQVFSSASYPLVQTMANAAQNPQQSLAADPDYLATANAFNAAGTVIQAYFLNPKFTRDAAAPELVLKMPKAIIEKAKADFVPIPAYSLVSFGHVLHQDKELALVALVYDSESDAKTAQAVIAARIPKYVSQTTQRLLVDLIAARQGTQEPPQIQADQATGKTVLVLTWSAPVVASDATPAFGPAYPASGLLFHLLVASVQQRDAGWLAVEFSAASR